MSRATAARPMTGRGLAPGPGPGLQTREVGPGWEVLLMPEPLALSVLATIAGSPAAASAVGWIFAHDGHWGVFLPKGSDDPAWPPHTTYLTTGASVTLPAPTWAAGSRDGTTGWVNLTGEPLSRPLLLHPIVTLLASSGALSVPTACTAPFPATGLDQPHRLHGPAVQCRAAESTVGTRLVLAFLAGAA